MSLRTGARMPAALNPAIFTALQIERQFLSPWRSKKAGHARRAPGSRLRILVRLHIWRGPYQRTPGREHQPPHHDQHQGGPAYQGVRCLERSVAAKI